MSYTIAIGSLGTIGYQVAKKLDEGIEGLTLSSVSANDKDRAAKKVSGFSIPPAIVSPEQLADSADILSLIHI